MKKSKILNHILFLDLLFALSVMALLATMLLIFSFVAGVFAAYEFMNGNMNMTWYVICCPLMMLLSVVSIPALLKQIKYATTTYINKPKNGKLSGKLS